MTDQATAENVRQLPVKAPLATGSSVAAIVPTDIDGAWRFAGIVAKAGWAPKSYGKSQDAIMVGIIAGMEVGLPPLAALQSVALINGMPSLYGDGLLGVVRASGLLEDIVETVERDSEGEPMSATCRAKRVGQATWIEHTFTRADAVRAKLWNKAGPWTEYRPRMMQMRARGWVLRDGFSDVTKGMYCAEEAIDGGHLIQQGDGSYAPPPRPQRADFETTPEPIDEALAGDVIENEAGEAEPMTEAEIAAVAGGLSFVDLDGVERASDSAAEAAGAFEHAINECETKEQAATLWDDNEAFRDAIKEADSARHLGMRQFYADVSGAVPG